MCVHVCCVAKYGPVSEEVRLAACRLADVFEEEDSEPDAVPAPTVFSFAPSSVGTVDFSNLASSSSSVLGVGRGRHLAQPAWMTNT